MMFRSSSATLLLALATAACAQRPTATLINPGLVRLDLDGIRLFAGPPDASIGVDDIALFPVEPVAPVTGGRTFMPSMEGELLDRRTERLGEKTSIFVHAVPVPYGDTAHYSYLVSWNDRRIWFSGLATDPAALLAATDLDLVFLTPAMASAIEATGKRMNTRMMVLYPLPDGYDRYNATAPCDYCKVLAPKVGETVQLFR